MPTATTSLTLATQKPFGNLTCDFYKNDAGKFFMTRKQIGEALEYPNAEDQIKVIHSRHRDRFDPVSFRYQIDTPAGPRETYVYTLKGAMEICRFSRQPKADKFMDFVWDVMDALMKGDTILAPAQQQSFVPAEAFYHLADTISQNSAATKLSLKNGRQSRKSNKIKTSSRYVLLTRRGRSHRTRSPRRPGSSLYGKLFKSGRTAAQAWQTQKYIISR